jgi:hypothetical protein
MSSKFGFLSELYFLQDMASWCVSSIDPPIIYTIEKYWMLSKLFHYTALENVDGDYLEFGVFSGSSFSHAIRAYRKNRKYEKTTSSSRFFGFDSFEGFGKIEKIDEHPFYDDSNFPTSYQKVSKRLRKFSKDFEVKLIKGYFNETLQHGAAYYGIEKARIIFIDSDTYTAARDALSFCRPLLQLGTVIVFDEILSYKGDVNAGELKAFTEFLQYTDIKVAEFGRYGIMGRGYVVNNLGNLEQKQHDVNVKTGGGGGWGIKQIPMVFVLMVFVGSPHRMLEPVRRAKCVPPIYL